MSAIPLAAPRRGLRILRRPSESIRPAAPRPERQDCHGRLGADLLALAGNGATRLDASFRPWCSATFVGAQHRFTLSFAGEDAAAQAALFADRLPDADFAIPGHIVADATVDALRDGPGGAVLVDVAALTVEDW
ncbi:MAG: hypothetical protein J7494_00835 [Sphingobium sp.]|nr:hypothetical protein [Sphingobium sp.]